MKIFDARISFEFDGKAEAETDDAKMYFVCFLGDREMCVPNAIKFGSVCAVKA